MTAGKDVDDEIVHRVHERLWDRDSVCRKLVEDAGFRTDADGHPIRDIRGNTISKFAVGEIEERDSDQLIKAFGDGPGFMGWMLSKGISEHVAKAVAGQST